MLKFVHLDKDMKSDEEADSLAILLVVQYLALENSVAFLQGYAFYKKGNL